MYRRHLLRAHDYPFQCNYTEQTHKLQIKQAEKITFMPTFETVFKSVSSFIIVLLPKFFMLETYKWPASAGKKTVTLPKHGGLQ